MQQHIIRTAKTDSVETNEKRKFLEVELQKTSKLTSSNNFSDVVDSYDRFKKERGDSERFRLIFSINPFCSNVLFNTLTEITNKEGSTNVEVINDITNTDNNETIINNKAIIGNTSPERWEMLMNTEYNKPEIGFEYKPGFDIFTNHLLRNKTFKMVNYLTSKSVNGKDNKTKFLLPNSANGKTYHFSTLSDSTKLYNTIGDFMRYDDSTAITYYKREKLPTSDTEIIDSEIIKHLYDFDDILTFEESIENNITENNGWIGFYNNSSIKSKSINYKSGSNVTFVNTDNERVLNSREGCEFIDMYPDRTLFSFKPKFNKYRNREERNWDIFITYPYENYYDNEIVQDNSGFNGMLISSIEKTINHYGEDTLLIRTYIKHNLKKDDTVTIYAKKNNNFVNIGDTDEDINSLEKYIFIVKSVGDISGENTDYYFTVTDMAWLENNGLVKNPDENYYDLWCKEENGKYIIVNDDEITTLLSNFEYRFRKNVQGSESEYYFRIFRKLPNLKNAKENLTDVIGEDKNRFNEYVKKNSQDRLKADNALEFENKLYKLAFSRTIYNDGNAQVTFTDTIDLHNIRDNRNKPLTEIYFTVVKRNQGYKEWYYGNDTDRKSDSVEFSHCFGEVNSGLEIYNNYYDDEETRKRNARLGDVHYINMLSSNNGESLLDTVTDGRNIRLFNSQPLEVSVNKYGTKLNKNVPNNELNDKFLGDIVEYNKRNFKEVHIEWVSHRFNTMQRELSDLEQTKVSNNNREWRYGKFYYQEIENDDYDKDDGLIIKVNGTDTSKSKLNENNKSFVWETELGEHKLWVWQRPEGYWYHPFYKIDVAETGSLKQGCHYELKLRKIITDKVEENFILTTTLKHNLDFNDCILLCNKTNNKIYRLRVSNIIDKYRVSVCFDATEKRNNPNIYTRLVNNVVDVITTKDVDNNDITTEVLSNDYVLRVFNPEIPIYAERVGENSYFWRDILHIGDEGLNYLPEYRFSNGAFYVHQQINFYLKRQDPHNDNGVQCYYCFPNDIMGDKIKENNYFYKDETFVVC